MRRTLLPLSASIVALVALLGASASLQERSAAPAKGGVGDITGPYEVPDPKWPA